MVPRTLWTAGVCLALALPARAPAAPPPHGDADLHALAGTFRAMLVEHAPAVLYEASPGWGHTTRVVHGVRWTGKHLPVRPELTYTDKNDGTWRKVRVVPVNLADTLVFDLRNLCNPEPGHLTFDAFVSCDAQVDFDQENWHKGVRLYAGSARARLRIRLLLGIEVVTRLEDNGSPLPDAVFRMRVLRADLSYDNLVVEHVAGVGGEAAKVLGDAVEGSLREWHPSLERELLVRADAAIVEAGDTREVRVGLSGLFGTGDPVSAAGLKLLPGRK